MKLADLCEVFHSSRFPALGERAHPDRSAVLDARSAIATAVIDDEFLADCLSWELSLLETNELRCGLVPFYTLPGAGVRFALGYWPPGGTPGPHEHTAWTISAVCRNELEVLTYHRDETYRRRELVPKSCFRASAGKVGFIYEPCIHAPRNPSRAWSLTLHVSSPRDGEPPDDQQGPMLVFDLPSRPLPVPEDLPFACVLAARQRRACAHQLAGILAAMEVPTAAPLLAKALGLASAATRRRFRRPAPDSHPGGESEWVLARTHGDLLLDCCEQGSRVVLYVETANGRQPTLVQHDVAREAFRFIARHSRFAVRALPGNLTDDERVAIADALEESGLFSTMRP